MLTKSGPRGTGLNSRLLDVYNLVHRPYLNTLKSLYGNILELFLKNTPDIPGKVSGVGQVSSYSAFLQSKIRGRFYSLLDQRPGRPMIKSLYNYLKALKDPKVDYSMDNHVLRRISVFTDGAGK